MNRNNPLLKLWFWLLIISVIGFIVAFIAFERTSITNGTNTQTPAWIWILIIVSFLLLIISLILYAIDMAAYHKRREIAEACGEILPPAKKKIECPKKECVERKVIECKKPCADTIVTQTIETVESKPIGIIDTPATIQLQQPATIQLQPPTINTMASQINTSPQTIPMSTPLTPITGRVRV